MKKLVFIFLLSLSATVYAQNSADSVYFYTQSLNNLSIDQQNSTFLISNSIDKTGSAQVFYKNISGGYRTAQQAQKNTIVGLNTEGINKFGRFVTSGYFRFTRTWQDSLAWSTKRLEQDDQPYYYGSIKAGSFKRIKYNLGGNLSYNLIKNKLYIGGGATFMYNSSTRSVDPRPQVNSFYISITPELTYKVKNQYIGLKGKWGYGTETSTISFTNDDYRNSTGGYPNRINYLLMGYGTYKNNQGVSQPLRRLDKYYGLGMNYSGQISSLKVKTTFNYEHQQEDFYQYLENSTNRAYIGYYDSDLINYYVQLDQEIGNLNHQLCLDVNEQNSNDINAIFYAINYRYKQDLKSLKYLIHINKNQKLSPEFGVNAIYKAVKKSDYSADHMMSYSWIEPAINAALYYLPNQENRFYTGIEFGYRKPRNSSLAIGPNQENLFTYWIVYPNYSYDTSSAYKLSGELKYITTNILKQFKTGFAVKATYYKKDKTYNLFEKTKTNLDNDLLNINFSINLYL